MMELSVHACPIILSEDKNFIVIAAVECSRNRVCNPQAYKEELYRVLKATLEGKESQPEDPRIISLLYGGIVLLYKSPRGLVPLGRLQVAGNLQLRRTTTEHTSLTPLDLWAELYFERRVPTLVSVEPILVVESGEGDCRIAPVGYYAQGSGF